MQEQYIYFFLKKCRFMGSWNSWYTLNDRNEELRLGCFHMGVLHTQEQNFFFFLKRADVLMCAELYWLISYIYDMVVIF